MTEISIHALLAESDLNIRQIQKIENISIHALLAESDFACRGWFEVVYYFYPRSPCGERHDGLIASANFCRFLSTLSLRRATLEQSSSYNAYMISIHALLAESDGLSYFYIIKITRFLSTLSLRRATSKIPLHCCLITNFYPRSPCGERLLWALTGGLSYEYFYPRSPCGERLLQS